MTTTTAQATCVCRCGATITRDYPHPSGTIGDPDRKPWKAVGGSPERTFWHKDGSLHEPGCPPSAVVDMIVEWQKVCEGDLILWDGEFRPVERVAPYGRREQGVWAVHFADIPGEVCIPAGTYVAVRRYVTGEG